MPNALTVGSFPTIPFSLTAISSIVSQNFLSAQGAEVRPRVEIVISVAEQRLALVRDGLS